MTNSCITDLHNLIEKGDIATAEKKYKHIARYVHIPQIYIFGMYIYFFKKDFRQFKELLSKGLHESPEDSMLFYQELLKFYNELTKKDIKELQAYIQNF